MVMQTPSELNTDVQLAPAHEAHHEDIADMFWHAKVASRGKFLLELRSRQEVRDWLSNELSQSTVALLGHQFGPQVVGHIGLMDDSESAATWGLTGSWTQVSRLCVDPVVRQQGIGKALVASVLGPHMFATVQAGSASHHLFVRSGMTVAADIVFPNNPAPGLLLVS